MADDDQPFVIVTFDPSKVNDRLERMEKIIDDFQTTKMPNQMQYWQDTEFNRIKPNQQTGSITYKKGTYVATKFWGKKIKPKRLTAGWKRAIKTWILRPQKQIILYRQMVELAQSEFKWPR